MKSRITSFVLALVCALAAFAAEPATFNVATYNLRLLNDGDAAQGDGWEQRHPYVAQLIRFHEFNIFGTQEGYKKQLEDLKALLP